MTWEIIVRYLHFVSIIVLSGAIVAESLLIQPRMNRAQIQQLLKIDAAYGISAILVLATGLLQWLAVGKPADFYSQNPVFHAKFGLFAILGILSAYPSVFFAKHRKGDPTDDLTVGPILRWSIRAEVVILTVMPLLASLMARGVGLG